MLWILSQSAATSSPSLLGFVSGCFFFCRGLGLSAHTGDLLMLDGGFEQRTEAGKPVRYSAWFNERRVCKHRGIRGDKNNPIQEKKDCASRKDCATNEMVENKGGNK